jgi:DNA replication protein DnaC
MTHWGAAAGHEHLVVVDNATGKPVHAATLGGWMEERHNLVIGGPTGVGKSWLTCALGHRACRDNHSVLYQHIPRMLADLAMARGDGRYARLMRALGGVNLGDWGSSHFVFDPAGGCG